MGLEQHLKYEKNYRSSKTQTTDDLWNIQNGYFQTETTFSTLIGKFEPEFSIPQMIIIVSLLSHNTTSACIPVKTVVSPIRLQAFSSCKAIKIWLKGVIPRASIYVISVAINGWAIFIIFLGSLFNEIKSTRTKIFRQIFANKRGCRVRLVEFDVIWSKILLPSKLWNGSHTLWLDCWFLTFYQNFEHIIFWCWVQYLLR